MVFYGFKDNLQKYKILAGIILKKPLTGPYSVHLDLTNHCNNDCISCWSFSPLVGFHTMNENARKKFIPKKLALKAISDLASIGTRQVYFTGGGEPFMHPDALEIMQFVKKKGMKCDMSTNFTLINEEKAKRLVRAEVDHINCSMWAGTPEAYEKTHPNKTAKDFFKIEKMLKFLNTIKKTKPKVTIYHVISSHNYDDFDNMVEFAFRVKADAVNFTPTDIVPGFTDSLMLKKTENKKLLKDAKEIWPKIKKWEKYYNHKIEVQDYELFLTRISSDGSGKGIYDKGIIGKIPCYAGFNFLRVLADGSVNSCLKSSRIPIGNIHKESIKSIWLSKEQKIFRKHTLDYNIDDPFFHKIGNTTQKGNGCLYCCDNIGWNKIFHNEVVKLRKFVR